MIHYNNIILITRTTIYYDVLDPTGVSQKGVSYMEMYYNILQDTFLYYKIIINYNKLQYTIIY